MLNESPETELYLDPAIEFAPFLAQWKLQLRICDVNVIPLYKVLFCAIANSCISQALATVVRIVSLTTPCSKQACSVNQQSTMAIVVATFLNYHRAFRLFTIFYLA